MRRRLVLALLAAACSSDGDGNDASSSDGDESSSPEATDDDSSSATSVGSEGEATTSMTTDTGTPGDDTGAPACALVEVPCEDAMVLDLSLVETVSEGEVVSTADGGVWRTDVDARAGGLPGVPTNPWVYIRFDDDGAHRVDIDDFAALESDAWHIAAKRYGLRLNGGSGGPSCVAAAPILDASFEQIEARPGVIAQREAFYDDACNLVDDGMGLGAPGYAMTPWWTYPGCVATTGVPFVVDLPSGRSIKLLVESYYASGQAECNENGTMGTDAGRFVWFWAWLP